MNLDDVVLMARDLMKECTEKNGAPAWCLTELAIKQGEILAKKYGVDVRLVKIALYLAHTVFSPIWKGEVQKNHPQLSSEFSKSYLDKWRVSPDDQAVILNAIEAHHGQVPTASLTAEVMKNAECAKFTTVQGALIWLHELGRRGVPYQESVEKVFAKMEQKRELLTLDNCVAEAEKNCTKIRKLFES
ncbi:hypothetical protein FWD20_01760 [Candidatus Saccharibacteria bacterium]|nr:hypothetical protein [Candidatus Saccharibacteria bacterium]